MSEKSRLCIVCGGYIPDTAVLLRSGGAAHFKCAWNSRTDNGEYQEEMCFHCDAPIVNCDDMVIFTDDANLYEIDRNDVGFTKSHLGCAMRASALQGIEL